MHPLLIFFIVFVVATMAISAWAAFSPCTVCKDFGTDNAPFYSFLCWKGVVASRQVQCNPEGPTEEAINDEGDVGVQDDETQGEAEIAMEENTGMPGVDAAMSLEGGIEGFSLCSSPGQ